MISTAYMMLVLWPAVFDGTHSKFECTLQRSQPATIVNFSGDVGSEGEFNTDLFKKIGDERALIGILQPPPGGSSEGRLVFASGPSNRFIWSFGSRPHAYLMELTDYPGDVAHFLLTEKGVSGGRHAFDRLIGFGTCKIALSVKGSKAR